MLPTVEHSAKGCFQPGRVNPAIKLNTLTQRVQKARREMVPPTPAVSADHEFITSILADPLRLAKLADLARLASV